MKYLHTMVRVTDLDASLAFYRDLLGLKETRRIENDKGRFTLVFLAPEGQEDAPIELTYNWDPEVYTGGRNFGHLAYEVDDIYAFCQKVMDAGVTVNRPPRDGHMAFIRSPDNISLEILQKGDRLAAEGALGVDAEHRRVVGHAPPGLTLRRSADCREAPSCDDRGDRHADARRLNGGSLRTGAPVAFGGSLRHRAAKCTGPDKKPTVCSCFRAGITIIRQRAAPFV